MLRSVLIGAYSNNLCHGVHHAITPHTPRSVHLKGRIIGAPTPYLLHSLESVSTTHDGDALLKQVRSIASRRLLAALLALSELTGPRPNRTESHSWSETSNTQQQRHNFVRGVNVCVENSGNRLKRQRSLESQRTRESCRSTRAHVLFHTQQERRAKGVRTMRHPNTSLQTMGTIFYKSGLTEQSPSL